MMGDLQANITQNTSAWKIDSLKIEIRTVPERHSHEVSNPMNYSILTISIILIRNPTTAIYYVIVPTIAISIFNIVAFLLPPQEGTQ